MGVAGSGKTMIGTRLADALGLPFVEGDDFHAPANVEKMRRGIPLTEEERGPWLDRLHAELEARTPTGAVLAGSALTDASRRRLTTGVAGVRFVLLRADEAVLRSRLEARTGHYAGADLLASQLATLQEPDDAVVVDVDAPPDAVVARVVAALDG